VVRTGGDTAVLAARVTTSHFTWSAAAGGGGCEKVVSRAVWARSEILPDRAL